MFHLLGYNVTAGVNDANVAMTAYASDPSFTTRNGSFIFSEAYQLCAAYHQAASALRSRFNTPSINAVGNHQIWGVNRSATVPANPLIEDLRSSPLRLPMNEEIGIQESNNLGAATEQTDVFLWVAPLNWNRNLPPGLVRLTVRATAAATRGDGAWGAFAALTFEAALRGGWYSVVGCEMMEANSHAFLLNFPRQPQVGGRKMFPGGLALNAIGNAPAFADRAWMGHWGTFHSFEPPTIAVTSTAAGAGVQEVRLDLVYHGDTPPGNLVSSSYVP